MILSTVHQLSFFELFFVGTNHCPQGTLPRPSILEMLLHERLVTKMWSLSSPTFFSTPQPEELTVNLLPKKSLSTDFLPSNTSDTIHLLIVRFSGFVCKGIPKLCWMMDQQEKKLNTTDLAHF